jgi:hypothetical protein
MSDPIVVADPNWVDASALEERRRRRARRRFAAWGAFLLLGLALGAVYATGFATTGGTTGSTANASANTNTPAGNEDTNALNPLVSSGGDLSWSWAGRWGSVASKAMYTADLDTLSASNNYYVGVYLTNSPSGFSDLQLQLRIADVGTGGTCNAAAIDGVSDTDDYRVMLFDSQDAEVTFSGMNGATSGLPGGSTYCIGISNYANSGKDTGGTFIRKSATGGTFSGTYPTFIATLNRMS